MLVVATVLNACDKKQAIDPEKPRGNPPAPKPALTITQAPKEGPLEWGRTATLTVTAQNGKFFFKGDSVTTATFKIVKILNDTTLAFTARGKGGETQKSHTIKIISPKQAERDIIGVWRAVRFQIYDKVDPNDMDPNTPFYWTQWKDIDPSDCRVIPTRAVLHYY